MAKRYADSTLLLCTKAELIKLLRIAERNEESIQQQLNQQYENVKDWEPVVHGRWMRRANGEVYCSHCNCTVGVGNLDEVTEEENYCYNCGARMDEEQAIKSKTSGKGGYE